MNIQEEQEYTTNEGNDVLMDSYHCNTDADQDVTNNNHMNKYMGDNRSSGHNKVLLTSFNVILGPI